MSAQGDSSGVQYFNFSEYSHHRNECPQNDDKKKPGHNGGKPRWKKNGPDGGSSGGRGTRGGSVAGHRCGGRAT